MKKNKKYEIEVKVRLLIEADEKGEAIANADMVLLKLKGNLLNSDIVSVKDILEDEQDY